MSAPWRSGPLAVPAFRLLTVGQFASNVGDCCYAVALPWLVLSGHGSTVLLGALLVLSAAGAIAGSLGAARGGGLRRPMIVRCPGRAAAAVHPVMSRIPPGTRAAALQPRRDFQL